MLFFRAFLSRRLLCSYFWCRYVDMLYLLREAKWDDATAGLLDSGSRAFGNADTGEREFLGDLAVTDDLDHRELSTASFDDTLAEECLRIDLCPRFEDLLDASERNSDRCGDRAVNGATAILAIAAALRELFDDVAKFWALLIAGASALAFGAATGCLAALTAATDACLHGLSDSFE